MWPVRLESVNGHFCASILGNPDLRVEGTTREEALGSLRIELNTRMLRGEIVMMAPVTGEIAAHGNGFDIDAAFANADYGETPEDFIRALYAIRDSQKHWDLQTMDRT
ncbi:hypothetical protein BH11PLA2_BH11PLA2_32160 [soil metagenome]